MTENRTHHLSIWKGSRLMLLFFYCIFLLRDLGVIYEEKKELALELDPNKFNFVQTAWIFHSASLVRRNYWAEWTEILHGTLQGDSAWDSRGFFGILVLESR